MRYETQFRTATGIVEEWLTITADEILLPKLFRHVNPAIEIIDWEESKSAAKAAEWVSQVD